MVELLEFIKSSSKLYFSFKDRVDGYDYINTYVLWQEPYFLVLILSLWYYILTTSQITILSIIGSIINFSLATFLAISAFHYTMVFLGGIGTLKDMYKFGLSIWLFPSIINLLAFIVSLIFQNSTISYILGVFLSLLGIYSIIISILIYGKVQNLSTEYTFLGMLIPFLITSIILVLFKLTL